ncbi:MAG: 4'-phosphopantetheinyl transferase superfamily protein [Gemmatimonadaceae bacterium]|nr:4'-phosphopantetheinyl transferase superfamily protein [Chitinophagaceae bacterium]
MPLVYQHNINEHTRLGVWHIREDDEFFLANVPLKRGVTHPHKRLQHLAGRFLLPYLFDDFPLSEILIADTRKPFLEKEQYHFSISHCGDYAAAIVSRYERVGIDIEMPAEKITRIREKFLGSHEKEIFHDADMTTLTLLWSAKESVFKWYGIGGVDFSDNILLTDLDKSGLTIQCRFTKTETDLQVRFRLLENIVLTWVNT